MQNYGETSEYVQSQAAILLKQERHRRILEALRRDGKVVAASHHLQRVHGGALPPATGTTPWTARQSQAVEAKRSIGAAAARLVKDGQVILVSGGTTALRAVESFPRELRATVITNSPPVATALAEHEHVDVVLAGGWLLKESLVTLGAAALSTFSGVRADLCLLGACGAHPEMGLMVTYMEEAHVMRTMMASSAVVAGLVSAEKLGTDLRYVVAPLSSLTHLITESGLPEEILAPYRGRVNVIEGVA